MSRLAGSGGGGREAVERSRMATQRGERCGVRPPAHACGESSRSSLSTHSTYLDFSRCAQDRSTYSTRRCSSPATSDPWPPFSSRRDRRRTPSARAIGAGGGRGCGRAGGRGDPRMRRSVAAERERTPEDIPIGYCTHIGYCRLCILHPYPRFCWIHAHAW